MGRMLALAVIWLCSCAAAAEVTDAGCSWDEYLDPTTQRFYYNNPQTGDTLWELPAGASARRAEGEGAEGGAHYGGDASQGGAHYGGDASPAEGGVDAATAEQVLGRVFGGAPAGLDEGSDPAFLLRYAWVSTLLARRWRGAH
jgi:hypothetical protein